MPFQFTPFKGCALTSPAALGLGLPEGACRASVGLGEGAAVTTQGAERKYGGEWGALLSHLTCLPLILALLFTKHFRQPFLVLEFHFILNCHVLRNPDSLCNNLQDAFTRESKSGYGEGPPKVRALPSQTTLPAADCAALRNSRSRLQTGIVMSSLQGGCRDEPDPVR